MTRNVGVPPFKSPDDREGSDAALQRAFQSARRLLGAGRLDEAKAAYQDILRRHPRSAPALHFLGVIAVQEGRPDLAIELMSKAIAENRAFPVFHGNLGEAYRAAGRFDEAIACCRRALEVMPVYPEALNTLGAALYAKGDLDEAAATLKKAIEFKPDVPEVHANLGNVLRAQGKLDRAVGAYRRALGLAPKFAGAHAALGRALEAQGESDEAVASYRRALEIAPKEPAIWSNLGVALRSLGRTEDAIESFRQAIAIDPDLAGAHTNLGMALLVQGKLDEAVASYATALRLKRGTLWRERAEGAGQPRRDLTRYATFRFTAENKLRHDIEQFRYLIAERVLPASFEKEVEACESVLAELKTANPCERVALTSEQQERIGDTYNRAVYIAEAPARKESPINPRLDVKAVEDDYHRNAPGITVVDGLLTAEALDALRRFCLESTIWYDFQYQGGYLGAYMSEGFSCGLLFRIVEDLRTTFPGIFGEHLLRQMWAYKYDSGLRGIGLHADAAAINVNFWITPDDANLDPESGGLVVYKREAPLEWDFEEYNKDQERIRAFLGSSESVTVPYRENRAVIFNSNLFHKSDAFRFKDGYENRRINITMLFGFRGGAKARS